MSRYANLCGLLPRQLKKYDESQHKAIVETFAESIGDWSTEQFTEIMMKGLGISKEANGQIELELSIYGVDCSGVPFNLEEER